MRPQTRSKDSSSSMSIYRVSRSLQETSSRPQIAVQTRIHGQKLVPADGRKNKLFDWLCSTFVCSSDKTRKGPVHKAARADGWWKQLQTWLSRNRGPSRYICQATSNVSCSWESVWRQYSPSRYLQALGFEAVQDGKYETRCHASGSRWQNEW